MKIKWIERFGKIDVGSALKTAHSFIYLTASGGHNNSAVDRQAQPFSAFLLGLDVDGSLRVRLGNGELRSVHFGEVHLRPV